MSSAFAVFKLAAKSHPCDDCGEQIVKGDRYIKASRKHAGDFERLKFCLFCASRKREGRPSWHDLARRVPASGGS
ncbi:MAG: hypothetical protein GY882_01190 [Actinomycetia bacterium]|nr:hypothetical protein [Actinomycetes bacterium]